MNNPPYPIQFVQLREIIDDLKPGQWAVYSCVVKLLDGTVLTDCSIESNPSGINMDYDTIMDEAGNSISSWVFESSSSK